jgi:hypothetical protein
MSDITEEKIRQLPVCKVWSPMLRSVYYQGTRLITPLLECIRYAAVKQRRNDPCTSESSAQIGCDVMGMSSSSSDSLGTHHSAGDKATRATLSALLAVNCSKAFLSRDTVVSLATTHSYSRLVRT